MRRSDELIVESAVIASILIMLTLGGSIATTTTPPSFADLQNPSQVPVSPDLNALANYYNTTLTQIGARDFANASFLLSTFRFVNIPASVNATAQSANSDLSTVSVSAANATTIFAQAELEIMAMQYINATRLASFGCNFAKAANSSLADFQGPQTTNLQAESVPVVQYSKGSAAATTEVDSLLATCSSLSAQRTSQGHSYQEPLLQIGSPQKEIETGGTVELSGNLTINGTSVSNEDVLFYINGSYFGSLVTSPSGGVSGTLPIPFIYSHAALVQALVEANSTRNLGGATSNPLVFTILFDQTSLVLGDPPAYLPGATFDVHGNLTTTNGVPLPDAPVTVNYLHDSVATTTDGAGTFKAQFTVPNNATDGTYFIFARFSPMGVYGPSFNFTSIDVYHLHLALVLSVPGLSWAGFSTNIGGTATSNGTAVANAAVTLVSPWGTSTAKTDSTGHFDVALPVSPLEFASSKNVAITVSPSEPYIAGSTVVITLGLFNILVVVLPVAIIGVAGYEAYSLGVFQEIRTRVRGRERETAQLATVGRTSLESIPSADEGPEPLRFLGRALLLASTRFSIVFRPSQTIREILSLVRAKDDGEAFVAFSRVLLTAEDFLYGQRFESSRTEDARKALFTLQVLWS